MTEPYLRIVEQPEPTTRFRYQSERKHGFLLGANSPPGALKHAKSYPTVELLNYSGKARIEVRLCQEAPSHQYHPADSKLKSRSQTVPQSDRTYFASFDKIRIILLTNDEITKRHKKTTKETYAQCKPLEAAINKYAVRLRFSAHHPNTGNMICPPVYSTTVKHCKEKLTIVNYIFFRGSPKGRQPLWINVEGINIKNNIRVVFFEEMPDGSRYEFDEVKLNETHFHHMHNIVTETPPYPNEITEVKQVKFLLRDVTDPDDPVESESRPYEYEPHKVLPISAEGRTHTDSTSSSSTGYSSSKTESLPKRHKRPTSRSLCSNCRKQLSLDADCFVSDDVVDLTSESSDDAIPSEDVDVTHADVDVVHDDVDVIHDDVDVTHHDVSMSLDDMQLSDVEFDISELEQLQHINIPIEPSPFGQQVMTSEMFIKDDFDYQRASFIEPMTSLSDPVLGEVNVLINNNNNNYQHHQVTFDVNMDEDDFWEGAREWVSDSGKPSKNPKKNDWNHRIQDENVKLTNNNTIIKTSQRTQDRKPLQEIRAAPESNSNDSSGEEYETAEGSDEEMVWLLHVLKTE